MELSHKSCLVKLFLKLSHGTVVQKLLHELWHATPRHSEACWAQSNQSGHYGACSSGAEVALQSYFMRFCMELSCKTCLSKLVFRLLRGTIVHELPFEAIV